jgi:hypothetical protein
MSIIQGKNSILLAALAILVAGNAQAAASGQLTISGTVALVNSIVVNANGTNHQSLNIQDGETGKSVASVDETSNDANGYTINLSSANGGELRNSANASKKTTYQISYDGNSFAQPSSLGASVKSVSSLPGLTTHSSNVVVKVIAAPSAPAGTYSDVITLTIVANP